MERTQCQLCTRLADGLCGNHTHSLTFLYHAVVGQVTAVTLGADAFLRFAGEYRTNLDLLDRRLFYLLGNSLGDLFAGVNQNLVVQRIHYIVNRHTTQDSLAQRGYYLFVVLNFGANQTTQGSAVLLVNNHVVGYVDQTTGQVTGIGCLQGGIGKTLTSTVRGDEVLQHRQALLEVGQNRVLDDLTTLGTRFLRLGHQTTHTGELTNLVLRTTGSRVEHHEYRVETLIVGRKLLHQDIGQTRVDVRPGIDNLVVALVVGNETHVVVVHNLLNLGITFGYQRLLFRRNEHVAQVERQTALEGHVVTQVLDVVEELGRTGYTAYLNNPTDDVAQRFLRENLVDVADLLGYVLVHQYTAYRCILDHVLDDVAIFVDVFHYHRYGSVQRHLTFVVGNLGLFGTVEFQALAQRTGTQFGDVVQTQYHVLRRHGDRRTVGRVQNVVSTQHQQLGFEDSLVAERQVHGHLVTVEVGVECRTCQRVQLDSLTLDHLGLEGLDTQTVQRRGTVQQHGVTLHHVFEDIPYNGLLAIHNLLGRFHGLDNTALNELADNEGFIKFGRHVLGQTAFMHLQLRTYNDNRTGRVVDTFTEQILTETTLFTFQAVGE